jgi:hypothetical protein
MNLKKLTQTIKNFKLIIIIKSKNNNLLDFEQIHLLHTRKLT